MNGFLTKIIFVILAYLLGSIPFGLLAGWKAKKIDIREHGSKNIGATNVFRVVGKKWGITVLLLDAFKGYAACALPAILGTRELSISFQLMLGISSILGHSFPIWLKFKGGKGVATSLGVFLAICFQPTLVTFGIWILVFMFCRIISFASLVAALAFPCMIAFFYWGTSELKYLLPIAFTLTVFIFYTHRNNIQRLRQGAEKKLL